MAIVTLGFNFLILFVFQFCIISFTAEFKFEPTSSTLLVYVCKFMCQLHYFNVYMSAQREIYAVIEFV